jgi:ATP-dependent Clp protease protease subunit
MMRLDEETEEERGEKKLHLIEDKIDEALLKARRIFFSEAVDGKTASDAIRRLWYLELVDPGKPILFVINSPGGSVDAGFAVFDQVKMVSSPVTTIVTGLAASMGTVLSLCGAPGRRYATPNARYMVHQPSIHGVMRGQATDLEIQAKELLRTRKLLCDLYEKETGMDHAAIEKMIDRDNWMTAEEACASGFLNKVVRSFKEIPPG